jgi:hypothetical protein
MKQASVGVVMTAQENPLHCGAQDQVMKRILLLFPSTLTLPCHSMDLLKILGL